MGACCKSETFDIIIESERADDALQKLHDLVEKNSGSMQSTLTIKMKGIDFTELNSWNTKERNEFIEKILKLRGRLNELLITDCIFINCHQFIWILSRFIPNLNQLKLENNKCEEIKTFEKNVKGEVNHSLYVLCVYYQCVRPTKLPTLNGVPLNDYNNIFQYITNCTKIRSQPIEYNSIHSYWSNEKAMQCIQTAKQIMDEYTSSKNSKSSTKDNTPKNIIIHDELTDDEENEEEKFVVNKYDNDDQKQLNFPFKLNAAFKYMDEDVDAGDVVDYIESIMDNPRTLVVGTIINNIDYYPTKDDMREAFNHLYKLKLVYSLRVGKTMGRAKTNFMYQYDIENSTFFIDFDNEDSYILLNHNRFDTIKEKQSLINLMTDKINLTAETINLTAENTNLTAENKILKQILKENKIEFKQDNNDNIDNMDNIDNIDNIGTDVHQREIQKLSLGIACSFVHELVGHVKLRSDKQFRSSVLLNTHTEIGHFQDDILFGGSTYNGDKYDIWVQNFNKVSDSHPNISREQQQHFKLDDDKFDNLIEQVLKREDIFFAQRKYGSLITVIPQKGNKEMSLSRDGILYCERGNF